MTGLRKLEADEAGASFTIRNEIRQQIAARVTYLKSKDVNEAELHGLWLGLRWINSHMPVHRIWMEGDSLNVVNALKELNGVGGSCLLEDCRNMLRKAVRSRVEANKSAE